MYDVKYISDTGKTIVFNLTSDSVITTMKGITEHETEISKSQGFGQIGESVNNKAVRGRSVDITGQIIRNNKAAKKAILEAFPPLSSGVLWWENKYRMKVYVKHSPFIQQTTYAKFTLTLFAPYPFWESGEPKVVKTGQTTPLFSFPINYSTAHTFGSTSSMTSANCYVAGNLSAGFSLLLTAKDDVVNPGILNLKTQKYLKFIGELKAKEQLKVYKDSGRLHVEKIVNGVSTNAFQMLDDTSMLFELQAGDNPIRVSADDGIDYLVASIEYADTFAGVYYGM